MHLMHTKRAPQYLSDSIQTVARSNSRPGLRSSNTVSTPSRGAEPSSENAASLMLDLLHGAVFHTISIKSVTLVFSAPPQNCMHEYSTIYSTPLDVTGTKQSVIGFITNNTPDVEKEVNRLFCFWIKERLILV